jgi:hypothetical protein
VWWGGGMVSNRPPVDMHDVLMRTSGAQQPPMRAAPCFRSFALMAGMSVGFSPKSSVSSTTSSWSLNRTSTRLQLVFSAQPLPPDMCHAFLQPTNAQAHVAPQRC